MESEADVPSPIDLRTMGDARTWADEVSAKRPWRKEFFRFFADALRPISGPGSAVLELGSGPAFLAQHLLSQLSFGRYTALDFSDAMHVLARERLGKVAESVEFINRDFSDPHWTAGLPLYSAIVTIQAVHEVRHKRRVPALYEQVRGQLRPRGHFLMCDHYFGEGGMTNAALYMSMEEIENALKHAGFGTVDRLHTQGSMVLFRARELSTDLPPGYQPSG